MFLSLGTMLCLMLSYLLDKFVYSTYDLDYLSVVISVLIVGIYNLFVSKAFSKMSHYMNYLYEKSSSFVVDFVYILSLIFTVDFSLYGISEFLMVMLAIGVVLFVCNIIFGIFLQDCYKGTIDKHYLNVSSRLFLLAIIAMILYFAAQLI